MITQNNSDTPKTRLLNFAALCAWLVTSISMAVSSWIWFGQDFRTYYAAGRVLLMGGNPYDYPQLAPILLAVTGHIGNYPYFYPLWFAWLVAPLAWLPYQTARGVWILINFCLWAVGLQGLGKLLDWPEHGWRRWLMFLFATYLFAWVTWRYEQVGILSFFLLVAGLTAIQQRRWTLAGFWLALLLIKPNITLLPIAAILLWLIRRGQWKPLLVMCMVLAGLTIITTAATPDWFQPFLRPDFGRSLFSIFDQPNLVLAVRINTTLMDWLTSFLPGSIWRSIIYIIAAITGGVTFLFVVLRSNSLIKVASVSLLISFAITPYTLQYDFPLLTLPLFWATALFLRSPKGLWVGLAINAFLASVLIWERPISDGYWMVIGLIALTIWSLRQTAGQAIPEKLLLTEATSTIERNE